MMKICRICKHEKPLDRFTIRRDGASGPKHRSECKNCLNIIRANNPNYGKWHKENKERLAAYMREFSLKKHWNMTQKEFDDRLAAQGGVCAICKKSHWMGRGNKPHVDHCHASGKIRGLLCNLCNIGLGAFKDSENTLLAATEYLKKAK